MREKLRQLYERAGNPSKGALKRHADRSGHSVAESTLIGVPSGRGGLRWATVEAFVDACLSYAAGRPNDLLDSDRDKTRWRRTFDAAEPAHRRGRGEEAQRRLFREYGPGRLPRLSELSDAVLGVTPTRHTEAGQAPYIGREPADTRLRRILTSAAKPYPFVVLVGQSKAGKSRTLSEAVRSRFRDADPEVLIPRDSSALVELAWTYGSGTAGGRPALVWLDDLSISDLTGLTGQVLDLWAGCAVLCATMTVGRWDEVSFGNLPVVTVARQALRRAVRVDLEFDPTADELAEARRLYPGETFRGSVAETLVGGEQLLSRHQAGRETNPAGHAIVRAAVDVRRAGLKRAARRSELLALYPHYLSELRSDLATGEDAFANGLAWAKEPVASHVALLRAVDSDEQEWEVLDYIVAVDDGQGDRQARPVPEFVWTELLRIVTPEECGDIGLAGYARGAGSRYAVDAFLAASNSSSDNAAGFATLAGQFLMDLHGDLEGAKASFANAIECGDSTVRSIAMNLTGWALRAEGDAAGARRAFEQAAAENPAAAPSSSYGLGVLSLDADNYVFAEAAFRKALASDEPFVRPGALSHLGVALARQGKTDEARVRFEAAAALDDADEKARALVQLGMLHRVEGRLDAAREACRAAVETGHFEFAPKALLLLGMIAFDVQDYDDALGVLSQAIATDHSETAAVASFTLGRVHLLRGEIEPAGAAFAEGVNAGYLETSPDHAAAAALILLESDRVDEAHHCVEVLLESAADPSDEHLLLQLAYKLADSGDESSAEQVLWLATEAADREVADTALQILRGSGLAD